MIIEDHQRTCRLDRNTKEVSINVQINIDGTGISNIKTGIDLLDHLIKSFSNYSKIDIELTAKSQDGIKHHLIEDTAIVLGQAIDRALGKRDKISRFGSMIVPMDESVSTVAVDLIKRRYKRIDLNLEREKIEEVSQEDIIHFFESLVENINCCAHVNVQYGSNDHHKVESAIKALAVALRMAMRIDPDNQEVPSTKGMM